MAQDVERNEDPAEESQAEASNAETLNTGEEAAQEMPADDAATGEEADETVALSLQIADLQSELAEMENRLARSHAELANFRRRAANESEQFRKYEGINLIRDLLPTIDNLRRAMDAAQQASSIEDLKTGVDMVTRQLIDTLGRHNVERIPAEGEAFDPNQHEAVQQLPSDEIPAMHVMQELETGYRLHDRIVRPAKVIVSTGPAQS